MQKQNIGDCVCAIAGHDKDVFYIVIAEDAKYLYLADGVYKTVAHPKKKSKKHIQLIAAQILPISTSGYSDLEIKRVLKQLKINNSSKATC
ncbi:MAG: RNA-binding protein [Lachnospiraceae bacterium]|nr:RNA-binding protein [Lachnospiraceae bacterium]